MRAPEHTSTPSSRVFKRSRKRRGQTLVLALAILFLLITLGGIFITLLIRNLQRVTRQSETDESLTLALAGLQHVAQQFRSSPRGADWRPEPAEPLWRYPQPANATEAALRQNDPDFDWLDPATNNGFPFVRVPTGRGRFLMRVTYLPQFRPASAASGGVADEFDENSKMIRVEVVGRPGEFDPNDPTFFMQDPTRNRKPGNPPGLFRKLEAYVPIGLVDQLWWITNFTNERGPAKLGVPALKNPGYDPNFPVSPENQDFVQHRTLYSGGIRSNTDLQFLGTNTIRIYPARGEAVQVAGEITAPSQPNSTGPGQIDALDDNNQGPAGPNTYPGDQQDDLPNNDSILLSIPLVGSTTGGFTTGQMFNTGQEARYLVRDEAHRRADAFGNERSTRELTVPALNRLDATTGVRHYQQLTRDSGGTIAVPNGAAGTRLVNTGWYGLTDQSLGPQVRAKGLYLPNFDDIQHPTNRDAVKDEWLQRNKQNTGWFLGRYTPSVKAPIGNQVRPITEVILTDSNGDGTGTPRIRIERTDPDTAQFNVGGTASTEPGYFYDLVWNAGTPNAGTLTNPRQTREFDYPENGVMFCEGSIRIRGHIGSTTAAKQLTVVSGGTIYIEGNIKKPVGRPDSFLALMAQDYVTLNPTAFTRMQLNGQWTLNQAGDGVLMQQNSDIDFIVDDADGLTNALVHLRHSAMSEDTSSETSIHLFLPRAAPNWPDWNTDRYDFAANPPQGWPPAIRPTNPAEPTYAGGNQLFYWFHQISGGASQNWGESNYQTSLNSNEPNYERKSFYVPNVTHVNGMSKFRIHVNARDGDPNAPNQQDYLLSRVSVVPADRPLRVRIDAMLYAATGSWFIIPPPFFNQDSDNTGPDSRARLVNTSQRAEKTFPRTSGPYPFHNEALNIEVELNGAVNENFPAEAADTAAWISRMWVFDPNYNQTTWPVPAPNARPSFRPDIHYRYDHDFRRMVRVRILRTGQEFVAWTAPSAPPPGVISLPQVITLANNANSYIETLPVLPSLPASAIVYEGNPL